jgi:lactate dehydrogenase-like 2-hydroxyacid dehydrogenase
MKAVAFSVRSFEKEFLAKANQKKHDITLISNGLTPETAIYACGKEAVIVLDDDVNAPLMEQLANLGVKFIATRSIGSGRINAEAAANHNIKIADAPQYDPQPVAEPEVTPDQAYLTKEALQSIAYQVVTNLDQWQAAQYNGAEPMHIQAIDTDSLQQPLKPIRHAS